MNANSIVVLRSDYPSGHPFQTQALTGSTTSEQLFQVSNAVTAIVAIPSQTAILGSQAPFDPNTNNAISGNVAGPFARNNPRPFFNSSSFDGRAFRVRAMGKFNNLAATTNAQTIALRITASNAVSSSNVVAVITSATNVTSGNFNLVADLNWDSVNQVINGTYSGYINATTTSAAITNRPTITAYTGLQFVCSVVFSTSSASSTANLVDFCIEQI